MMFTNGIRLISHSRTERAYRMNMGDTEDMRLIDAEKLKKGANKEIWKPTYVFPDMYLVSNTGKLFSVKSNRILKPKLTKFGYYAYTLMYNNEKHHIFAHRLVAMAFIPNPLNKPEVDHINTIKTDNNVSNLRWVTKSENARNPITYAHSSEIGRKRLYELFISGKSGKGIKPGTKLGGKRIRVFKGEEFIGEFNSFLDAANYIDVCPSYIAQYFIHGLKSCKGYSFEKVDKTNG